MNARAYAQAFKKALEGKDDVTKEEYVENFLKVLEARGHRKLLSRIVQELERMEEVRGEKAVLRLARVEDAQKFQEQIEHDASLVGTDKEAYVLHEDDGLIGGYALETKDLLVDRTHKRSLLDLYRKLIA